MSVLRAIITVIILGAIGAAAWIFFLRDLVKTGYRPPADSGSEVETALPPDDGRFRWGVGIRPYALSRYTKELMTQQLDLAREVGTGWVRLSWHGWKGEDAYRFHDEIIDMARERGLHVVLVLEEIGVPAESPQVEDLARQRSREIAAHYKGRVTYFQLLNEVSGSVLRGPQFPGTDFERDYDQVKYRQIRDWLKGAGGGLKEGNPQARILITGMWTHTAIYERLIKDQVAFDILGWNWFSDMGEDLNGPVIAETEHQKITLLEKLKGFGKELWITELNYRPGETGMDESAQASYIKKMVERIADYQAFKGLFIFQLMDESEVASKGGKPEYYGIVKFAKDDQGNWVIGEKKQAFAVYRDSIAKLERD